MFRPDLGTFSERRQKTGALGRRPAGICQENPETSSSRNTWHFPEIFLRYPSAHFQKTGAKRQAWPVKLLAAFASSPV